MHTQQSLSAAYRLPLQLAPGSHRLHRYLAHDGLALGKQQNFAESDDGDLRDCD